MARAQRIEMNEAWFASLTTDNVASMGRLRTHSGIQVCQESDELLWLCGPRLEGRLLLELRSLLSCRVFLQHDDSQLVALGERVPSAMVPEGSWEPLESWLTLATPPKLFAAEVEPTASINLVRSHKQEVSTMVRIDIGNWLHYASVAPQIRLKQLQFAASDSRVVVRGEPLPPVQGEYFYVQHGIAVPVGFSWQPAVTAGVLRDVLKLEEGDIALLTHDGEYSRIPSDQFVSASRSSARLTAGGVHGGQ